MLSVRIRLAALGSLIAAQLFTQLFTLMATLKPRPVYKKQTTKRTMTEQTDHNITKVKSHLDDIYLIEREQLWNDLQQRVKIHNYECRTALEDLKNVVNKTKELYSKVRNNV